ncbi:transposase [Methylobacter sp. YRD-M1]|uniref:transposase n=1 Tax=Methylobacter sp. YRD-M1 TaxID=2911520 RepID=UPI00227B1326|nr:transposase [Methylobacter sp. YRD-M1]WAK02351.1 transposase [Methylobacter sp. YRD-M1]
MAFDHAIHHRRSIRLQGYDYSRAGAYFVTLCTQNRECLFGNILDGVMTLNDAGRLAEHWYLELENKYPDMQCDAFVCMPNHLHFIVVNTGRSMAMGERVVGADHGVRPVSGARRVIGEPLAEGEPLDKGGHTGPPLRTMVQWFKTMTTNAYIRGVKHNGWTPFAGKLWQRNYWERVIRNEQELNLIREYIHNNPAQWESDRLYRADSP